MSQRYDARQALTAMVSVITAYTSATGLSTATFATSMSNQATNDTGLTGAEKAIITQVTSAIGSAQPSSSIHGATLSICDTRTIYGAMVSVLTALTSAQGLTTGNVATQLSSMINGDTGLTSVESGLVTLFTSAIGSAQPSSSAHSQV
jgi:hypothetical protein